MPIQFSDQFWKNCWSHQLGVQNELRCAILAAGLGRRLEPLTLRYIPKPLFPLGGKVAMLETWVRKMVESGVLDVSMNLCVLKQTIKDHFGDGSKFGARIRYIEEDVPTGTLGGVCKQALGRDAKVLPGESPVDFAPFAGSTMIVPSGDIITNLGAAALQEMYEIHRRRGAAMTMALVPVPWDRIKDFGTAILESPEERPGPISRSGRIVEFHEKDPNSPSNLNNASVYLIEMDLLRELDPLRTPAAVDAVNPFYDFGKHVFPALLGKLPYVRLSRSYELWGVQFDGEWFDVGQKRDYLQVNEDLLDGQLDINLPFDRLPWGYLGTDVAIDFAKVNIIPPVVIGSHCTVEPGVTLGPYAVIGDGWTIERGARVAHSVLWEHFPLFRSDGSQLTPTEMRLIDRHEIRAGVSVERCIVASGSIDRDVKDATVEVTEEGQLVTTPLEYQPGGPRA